MAGLRKASAYSKKRVVPYTRTSKKRSKSYIKTIPHRKLVKLKMGNTKAMVEGKFKEVVGLVSEEKVLIRDNALEAVRQVVHKHMDKSVPGGYFFEVKVFPHHIMRENKMFSGGSKGERVNTGMSQSFGKTTLTAAMVKPGQPILLLHVNSQKGIQEARIAFRKCKPKIPCSSKIVVG